MMTNFQQLKLNSIIGELEEVCEELTELANEVSIADYHEGSNLSRKVGAIKNVVNQMLGDE